MNVKISDSAGRPALIDDVSGFEVGRGELLRLGERVYIYDGLERDPSGNRLMVVLEELGEEDGKLCVPADHPDLRPGPWLWDDWEAPGARPWPSAPTSPSVRVDGPDVTDGATATLISLAGFAAARRPTRNCSGPEEHPSAVVQLVDVPGEPVQQEQPNGRNPQTEGAQSC
jgi:hypothetical protein